jgi:LuxR family maltose regulon positive regulatory protein
MINLLLTKITVPHRRKDLLTRQRLIDLFDELIDNKLIIVTAPAGYGKTSLLVDIAHHHEYPFCWYALGPTDGDLQFFLTHFVASIEQKFPQFGEQSKTALRVMSQGGISLEDCEKAIVNEIFMSIWEHFVIVLDDYHLVKDCEAINKFVNRFVQDVDQNCHTVIITRALLPFTDLTLMVAHSQVEGIGLRELAFHPEEISSLLLQNYKQVIPDTIAEELALKTEGWITGLLLSTQTGWDGMLDQLRLLHTTGVGLYDYLIHHILDQQPPHLRDFLMRTSFMEEFDTQLCEALLGVAPTGFTWQGMIDHIQDQNLFVLPVEKEGFWLRYHHLFRDFLQNQLLNEQPEEADRILRSLIRIYIDREAWEMAYATCLRLGDINTTVDLLELLSEPMVKSGRMTLLGRWLDALPASVFEHRPKLLARQGIVLAMRGETAQGLNYINNAVAHFSAAQNRERLAGTLVWRALIYYIKADYDRSMADSNEVLNLTESVASNDEISRFRAEAFRILGQNYRLLGKLDQAIEFLSKALSINQTLADVQDIHRILLILGATYVEAGNFAEAYSCYKQALEYFQTRGEFFWLAAVLNDLACLHHLKGDFRDALETFEEALEKAKQGGNTRVYAMALIGLGDLFIDIDDPEAAAEAYHQAYLSAKKLDDKFLNVYINLAEVAVARLRGKLSQAHQLLEAAEQMVLQLQSDYVRGLYLLENGRLALDEGNFFEASLHLEEAAIRFEDGNQRIFGGRAFLLLASANFNRKATGVAVTDFEKAIRLTSELDSQYVLVPSARLAKPLLSFTNLPSRISWQALHLLEQVERFEALLPHLRRSLSFHKLTIPLTTPKLHIQALDAARVTVNNKIITSADWQTQTARDLLYLILSKHQGWSKEALGQILWPDSTPSQLKNRFRNTIYRLRRAMQQDVIIFDGENYAFNWNLDYEYDVEQFLRLLTSARNTTNNEERKKAYRDLIDIYRGEYLPEVEGVWVLPERERLRQVFINASLELAKLYLDASQNGLSLDVCYRLIAKEPSLEQAYYLAMQANAAIGNHAAVIHLHETLTDVLYTELGVSPSAQTETLYHSLIH